MMRQWIYIPAMLFCIVTVLLSGGAALASKWKMAPKKEGAQSAAGGWKKKNDSNGLMRAKNNYSLHCSSCHGENGDGKGPLSGELDVPPRDHTDALYMSSRTDAQLLRVISEGGAASGLDESMPPHNTVITKEEIEGLVKYLRKLCECSYKKE